jgi:hypothetical protein
VLFRSILLGPAVAGRLAPDAYTAATRGGVTQAHALRDFDTETAAQVAALNESGVSPEAITEQVDQRTAERQPLVEALTDARAEHEFHLNESVFAAIGVLLLVIMPLCVPRTRHALSGVMRPEQSGTDEPAHWMPLIGVASVWVAALAASFFVGELTIGGREGLVIGAALLAPTAAAHARRAAAVAILIASAAPLVLLLIAVAAQSGQWAGVAVGLPIIAVRVVRSAPTQYVRRWRRLARPIGLGVALPALAAFVTARLDPYALGTWTFLALALVALLASADLRWYLAGRTLRASHIQRPMTLAARFTNHGSGVATLMLTAAFFAAGLISETVAAALLLLALSAELTTTLRARIAKALDDGRPLTEALDDE